MITYFLHKLTEEMQMRLSGGLYHQSQVKFAFNSNRIDGIRLSEEQTRYIYETNTIGMEGNGVIDVDDIIETVNHFACFDYMLTHASEVLTEDMVKEFHRILKHGTSDARNDWYRIGDYKAIPNAVGSDETTAPGDVADEMKKLLTAYHQKQSTTFEDIVELHHKFERIHPFQDGNGPVGRIVMFKECLANDIMPFIIDHRLKSFYFRGLKEAYDEQRYLMYTCRTAQDEYEKLVAYFFPDEAMPMQSTDIDLI